MLIQNHQVACDSFQSPVMVHLEELPHAWQPVGQLERGKQDRPITRYTQSPQFGLAEFVVLALGRESLEAWMRIQQVARQLLIERCIRRSDPELTQLRLCMRPRQVERASRAVRIVIQICELDRLLSFVGVERSERYLRCSARLDAD